TGRYRVTGAGLREPGHVHQLYGAWRRFQPVRATAYRTAGRGGGCMNSVLHIAGFRKAVTRKPAPPLKLGIDQTLLVSSLLLLAIGIVMVTSASISIADRQLGDPFYFARRHLAYIGLGI